MPGRGPAGPGRGHKRRINGNRAFSAGTKNHLDLLGRGFTLFTGDAGAQWRAATVSASANLGIPVGFQCVGPSGVVRDIDGEWARVTGLSGGGALLVRPDDFVGWRAETLPTEADQELRRVLSQILARD